MATDPTLALSYASKAANMGDLAAPRIQAYLVDYCGAESTEIVGHERLSTISKLIVKLDPVYAYNARKELECQISFIKVLNGKEPRVNLARLQLNSMDNSGLFMQHHHI